MSENKPQYWRMQLHPNEPRDSMFYTVQCLTHGYIGLDFGEEVGDLRTADTSHLAQSEKLFVQIESSMKSGDIVLIMSHNKPFALVEVIGKYVYIDDYRKLSVWCPHLRPVRVLDYYADWGGGTGHLTGREKSSTIQSIKKQDGKFYPFVHEWFVDVCNQ